MTARAYDHVQILGDASKPKLDKRSFDLLVASRDDDIPKIMAVLKQVSA